MSQSQDRRQRQAVKKQAVKRQAKKQAVKGARQSSKKDGELALLKDVNEGFQALNDNQKRLGNLFNSTTRNIGNAFTLVDAHQIVTRRVLNDIVRGCVQREGQNADGTLKDGDAIIDYEWYFAQFNGYQGVAAFLAWCGKKEEEEKTTEEEPSLEDTNDVVFGGDHVSHQNSP